jgi:hypothetical protein
MFWVYPVEISTQHPRLTWNRSLPRMACLMALVLGAYASVAFIRPETGFLVLFWSILVASFVMLPVCAAAVLWFYLICTKALLSE